MDALDYKILNYLHKPRTTEEIYLHLHKKIRMDQIHHRLDRLGWSNYLMAAYHPTNIQCSGGRTWVRMHNRHGFVPQDPVQVFVTDRRAAHPVPND